MNTSEFVSRIDKDSISMVITKFFDEIMILYNLLGNRTDMTISADNSNSIATFLLNMGNEDEALNIYNMLNNTYFSIYSDKYIISMQLSGRSISTVIYKAIS